MAKASRSSKVGAAAALAARGVAVARKVDWPTVWARAQWLAHHSRRVYSNLSDSERREFLELLRKSKGRPQNVSPRDRDRLRDLVSKAVSSR